MNWRGVLYLGVRYLRRNVAKTALLVAAFMLVWLLPSAIALVVDKVETQLRARAVETPLVLGRAGSALELTFNALYFTKPGIATLPRREAGEVAKEDLATAIPVYARFSAGGHRIVGTTLDYFDFRELAIAEGRPLLRLGECVVGATVAEENDITPGDSIISSPESLFDLAGVYPLKMSVCGVLEPTGSPDDRAVFVDLRTSWIIEGLGHGHEDAEDLGEDEKLKPGDESIRLNASVMKYNEITRENVDEFHFHGDMGDNPVTAVVVVPEDAKSQAILKGRYETSEDFQLISPAEEMDELFATVFSVQRVVLWLLAVVGAATLAMGALAFLMSHRLGRDEFRHLRHLGADFATLRALIAFEAAFVIATSLVLSGLALWGVDRVAPVVIRQLLG